MSWSRKVVGYHDHIFWECRQRPKKVAKPADKLQRRLGWPVNGKSKMANLEVWAWMEEVACEVWRQKYGQRWSAVMESREDPALEESSSEDQE